MRWTMALLLTMRRCVALRAPAPLSSRWLLPAAGSGLLEAAGAASSLAPATALGCPSYRARRGCLWVAPGASRGHFSSLALSRDGLVYLTLFIFLDPCGALRARGEGSGPRPRPGCCLLVSYNPLAP